MSDADAICGRGCDCKDAPAAAIPEAQDGREEWKPGDLAEVTWRWIYDRRTPRATAIAVRRDGHWETLLTGTLLDDQMADPKGVGEGVVTAAQRLALVPSAAVREGERERLAAAWDYGWRAGWDDRESGDGQVTPNAYWPNDAATSLAAPEGTEQ